MAFHLLGAAAGLWQVEQRTFDGRPAEGGVFVPDLVPLGVTLPRALLLTAAYGVITWLLLRRAPASWWLAGALAIYGFVAHDGVLNVVALVLLALPGTRRDLAWQRVLGHG